MKLPSLRLETFLHEYGPGAIYTLAMSDCESFSIQRILALEPGVEAEFKNLWLGYSEPRGNSHLRKEIAGLYDGLEPRQVLVHSGAMEGIFTFMNVMLDAGDHVIVQSPSFQPLEEIALNIGAKVSPWMMKETTDGWRMDSAELPSLLQPNTRLLVINSPHNPTGHLFTARELEDIIDFCRAHQLYLYSDEVYRGLEYDESLRLRAACDLYENAISLGVMSKAYGLAGLRIGWLASRNSEILDKIAAFKDYTTMCNSAPAEFIARIALRNRRRILERNQRLIHENLKYLEGFLARNEDMIHWNAPKAGPIAFPRFKHDRDAHQLAVDMRTRNGVLILPGDCFKMPAPYFRMGFGRINFKECIDNFEMYLEKLGN